MTEVQLRDGHEADRGAGRLRELVRGTARRAGAEQRLVVAYETMLRALEPPTARRNRRDDERARLLAAAVLRSDSNCVDIGASEGRLFGVFAELAPEGMHIAYEPVPHVRASLARRFPRADVRGAALSDRNGEATFVVHRRLPSRSSLRPVGYDAADTETIRVRVETLDDSLPSGYVPRLVKLDVEGAEHLVLAGALRTLTTHKPVVLFEHQRSTAAYYGSGPERVFGLLVEKLDMRIFDLDGQGPYSLPRLRRAYQRGSRWNFFAVPAASTRRG
jgi:FkbM family methyltransferase